GTRFLRVWFNSRMRPCQGPDNGAIPFTRSIPSLWCSPDNMPAAYAGDHRSEAGQGRQISFAIYELRFAILWRCASTSVHCFSQNEPVLPVVEAQAFEIGLSEGFGGSGRVSGFGPLSILTYGEASSCI